MILSELQDYIEDSLQNSGCESAGEVDLILKLCTGLDRLAVFLERDSEVGPEAVRKAEEILERRARGEPLQYIAGKTGFMGFEFALSGDVLVPRPETEIMVESAVNFLNSGEVPEVPARVLDLGTGSGCIAISIALLCPHCDVVATDISPAALRVAARNASALGALIKFYEGDLFAALDSPSDALGSHRPLFSLIISNPPYIASGEIASLPREVREYEPVSALDGGEGGLEILERLIPEAPGYLLSGGLLLMEIGCDQGEAVSNFAKKCGEFSEISILKDYAGHDRILRARRM